MSKVCGRGRGSAEGAPPGQGGDGGGHQTSSGAISPASRLNQKWYGDGTEITTDEGKLHLASVLDMGSRRIIGFAMDQHHDTKLAHAALAMAVAVRGGKDAIAGVIMRTDQGSEYTARVFRAACARMGIQQSMGSAGSALDNAAIEAWHSTFEFELRALERFPDHTRAVPLPASKGSCRLRRRQGQALRVACGQP